MAQHEAVKKFEKELERIESIDIRNFLHNALVTSPASFYQDEELVLYTRKVFKVVETILITDEVQNPMKDVILSGVLLSDIALNELEEPYKPLHPLYVRTMLKEVKDDLVPQWWEGIIRIAEAHEGVNTPSKLLEPKVGTPEHLVARANALVRSDAINVLL